MRVTNWARFQHYAKRNPPWIKLATDTFQNYDFGRLQDASKLLAVCIMTIAARSKDGSLPDDLDWIKSQCCLGSLVTKTHLKELIDTGFLTDASETLADCKQSAKPERERETETETEREGETDLRPLDDRFSEFWEKYPSRRKVKKADAMKKWKAEKLDKIAEQILNGLENWKASEDWAKDNGEYICAPIVFLNQKRWLDEPQKAGLLVEKPKFESTNARFLRQLKEADDALNAEQRTYEHDEILKIGGENGR
jgi:hypothetical protein